ncbi:glycosyltransferase family protein [Sphingobacterium lumbrici]|uniref:glycosyltransferase family 4 protein n=1 Tax=Sphingobacterium lumbrici TaxID=2559600 RepID=UPI00112A816B|nr:glycosyltransferase family 4 protein [Sphingobacterium lumbrici]
MKKVLFITWDGPQTSYMEGLFLPIFREVMQQDSSLKFHVLQFTWADAKKIRKIAGAAQELSVSYHAISIHRKPIATIGSLVSLWRGSAQIADYVKTHEIDIVMPRSTFPAFMVNRLKKTARMPQIIFDADGLAIDERVDFAGLKRGSLQYKWLKSIERKMLVQADAVITRSQKAIEVHLKTIGEHYRNKFSVVLNGRNVRQFAPDQAIRQAARKELGISDELLWVYAGSLGPQYCWEEMLQVFGLSQKERPSKFLVLTGNRQFAEDNIPDRLKEHIMVKSVDFEHIPFYLNAGDVAFALRRPTYSMQGVAPIKLGEYLLMGLPTIASSGIGDTDGILQSFPECFIFDHKMEYEPRYVAIKAWMEKVPTMSKSLIREKAKPFFSMEKAGESYRQAISKLRKV